MIKFKLFFLFNTLYRFAIAFLTRSKSLNFLTAITIRSDFGAQENKICHCFHFFPHLFAVKWGTRTIQLVLLQHYWSGHTLGLLWYWLDSRDISDGQRFVTLYRRRWSRPSPRKRNEKGKMVVWGGLTKSWENKTSKRERRKKKDIPIWMQSSKEEEWEIKPSLVINAKK